MSEINETLVIKILNVVDKGLSHGLGTRRPGRFCVEAAICYALGLPHDDSPPCVDNNIRAIKISINDEVWRNKQVRAKALRRIAVAQLGSKNISYFKFNDLMRELYISKYNPFSKACCYSPVSINEDILNWINNNGRNQTEFDTLRAKYVEELVQIMIKLNTEGSKFLYLTEGN